MLVQFGRCRTRHCFRKYVRGIDVVLVSITRLRVRLRRHLLPFGWQILLTARQAQRAPGFLGGKLIIDAKKTFWTITAWNDGAAMSAYRNVGPHRRVMPKLLTWCDEASVVHWEQEGSALPDLKEAHRRMVGAEARPSKVSHPSSAHLAGQIAEPRSRIPERVLKPLESK